VARDCAICRCFTAEAYESRKRLSQSERHQRKTDRLTLRERAARLRVVPLLPAVRVAVQTYIKLCPHELNGYFS